MTYTFNFPNMSNGIDGTLTDLGTEIPTFFPSLLLFIYALVFIGGMISQKRSTGQVDTPLWATLAGVTVTMFSLILSLEYGIINLLILSTVVTITLLSAVWLFLSKGRYE